MEKKEKALQVATEEAIYLNAGMTFDDVVIIGISRMELRLKNKIKECKEELKEKRKGFVEFTDQLHKQKETFPLCLKKQGQIKDLKAALRVAGFKDHDIEVDVILTDEKYYYAVLVVSVDPDEVSYELFEGDTEVITSKPEKGKIPKSYFTAYAKKQKFVDEIEELDRELLKLETANENTSTVERQIRASMAENKLRTTQKGDEVVDKLFVDVDKWIEDLM